jgi:hypothetical protein
MLPTLAVSAHVSSPAAGMMTRHHHNTTHEKRLRVPHDITTRMLVDADLLLLNRFAVREDVHEWQSRPAPVLTPVRLGVWG